MSNWIPGIPSTSKFPQGVWSGPCLSVYQVRSTRPEADDPALYNSARVIDSTMNLRVAMLLNLFDGVPTARLTATADVARTAIEREIEAQIS